MATSSRGTVPKIDMSGRRPQDSFLTYGQKWLAMESLPENKNMKGVLDRSFFLGTSGSYVENEHKRNNQRWR